MYTIIFWLLVIAMLSLNFLLPVAVEASVLGGRLSMQGVGWVASMVLLVLALMVLGKRLTAQWSGVLIDERNRISLSRFQLVLWTVLVLPTLVTAATVGLRLEFPRPLDILVPAELWLLLGISGASFVTAPVVLQSKTQQKTVEPHPSALGDGTRNMAAFGRLAVNAEPKEASWSDLFAGDDDTNSGSVDLSKVQQFFFSVLTVLIYGAAVFQMLSRLTVSGCAVKGEKGAPDFVYAACLPELSGGIVALLGISHLAYIAAKATNKPPTV